MPPSPEERTPTEPKSPWTYVVPLLHHKGLSISLLFHLAPHSRLLQRPHVIGLLQSYTEICMVHGMKKQNILWCVYGTSAWHIPQRASQNGMCAMHPVLLTVVPPVSTASAMSLPLPAFWLMKVSEVKLLARITSLLAADHTASNGPPTAMVMTLPDVLLSAQQRMHMRETLITIGCHACRGPECIDWQPIFSCCTITTYSCSAALVHCPSHAYQLVGTPRDNQHWHHHRGDSHSPCCCCSSLCPSWNTSSSKLDTGSSPRATWLSSRVWVAGLTV